MLDRAEFFDDILKLKGFWKAGVSDKWKILVMWPFVFAFFLFCLVSWIPYIFIKVKNKFKKMVT